METNGASHTSDGVACICFDAVHTPYGVVAITADAAHMEDELCDMFIASYAPAGRSLLPSMRCSELH